MGDYTPDIGYKTRVMDSNHAWLNHLEVSYIKGKYTINSQTITALISLGFKKIQLVYVPLTDKDRSIIGQGVLTSTLGKVGARKDNSPFAYPDYFTRGNNELNKSREKYYYNKISKRTGIGQSLEWEHFILLNYWDSSETDSIRYKEIDS